MLTTKSRLPWQQHQCSRYDPSKKTKIAADASSYGLGAVLLQEEEPGTWKPVSFISRSMTATESKYAQIEKEALAVTWACERSSNYIIGKSITIETDHKPLVPLLTKHTIDKLPPRLQRYKMRLIRFHIKDVQHVPWKLHYTADTLSRKIAEQQTSQPVIEEDQMNAYVSSMIKALPASDSKLREIQQAQDQDKVCLEIKKQCLNGWPEKTQVSNAVKPYWQVRGELTIVQGLLLKGTRLVIPASMQRQSTKYTKDTKVSPNAENELRYLFGGQDSAHKSKNWSKTAQHAANTDNSIQNHSCQRHFLNDRGNWSQPTSSFYLLVADYYSRYVEVVALPKSTSSSTVIQALKTIYARHGVPDEVRSDNGPQYHSEEFAQFAKEWGFKHTTSSPRYPQANGEVERAVRTVKGILKKEKLGPNKGAVGIQIYTNSKWILTSRTPYGKKDKVNNSNHCKFTKIGTLSCYYRYINVLRGQFKKQKHSWGTSKVLNKQCCHSFLPF